MVKITKRFVEGLILNGNDRVEWDDEIKGFGIRLQGQSKSYIVSTRCKGRKRKFTLGKHNQIAAEVARQLAREIIAETKAGRDPGLARDKFKKSPFVKDLCKHFMSHYVPVHCAASTAAEYQRAVDLFIIPVIGSYKTSEIERADIAQLHHNLAHIPYQANRVLGVLSIMFKQAEIWNMRPDNTNPCTNVRRYTEKKRERFLSPEEYKRLGATLRQFEIDGSVMQSAIDGIWLLILTGCRLGEIQKLQWSSVDLNANLLRLTTSKTGAKGVPIGGAAVKRLKEIKTRSNSENNPYVITGKKPDSYLTDFQRPWRKIRASANLNDVRIHDLRHSYASNALLIGEGLPMIGKLLGHTQVQTTARYAHLANNPASSAAGRIADSIEIAMS